MTQQVNKEISENEYYEFQKFMYWKSLDDDSKKLNKYLLKTYNNVIDETIEGVKKLLKSEFSSVDDLQRFLSQKWIKLTEEERTKYIEKYILFALNDLGLFDDSLDNLEFNETVRLTQIEQRKQMAESFKYFSKQIIELLGDYTSVDSFESIVEKLNLIESSSKGFGKTIARTVSTQVTNTSLKQTFKTVNKNGEYELIWLSMRDKRVRPKHQEMDGKVMNDEGKFDLGDVELNYPGEFVNEEKANESLNCRCVVKLQKKKGLKSVNEEVNKKERRFSGNYLKANETVNDEGKITILASTYMIVDSYGDRIQYGAFDKYSSEKLPKIVMNHNTERVAGHFTKAYSLPPGSLELPEKSRQFGGWVLEGQLNMNTDDGKDLYHKLKAGDLDEFSVGYWLHEGEFLSDGTFLHKECECFEVSAVIRGANPSTGLLELKDKFNKAGRILSSSNYALIQNSVETIENAVADVKDLLNKASSSDEKSMKYTNTSINNKTFNSEQIKAKKERLIKLKVRKLKLQSNHY